MRNQTKLFLHGVHGNHCSIPLTPEKLQMMPVLSEAPPVFGAEFPPPQTLTADLEFCLELNHTSDTSVQVKPPLFLCVHTDKSFCSPTLQWFQLSAKHHHQHTEHTHAFINVQQASIPYTHTQLQISCIFFPPCSWSQLQLLQTRVEVGQNWDQSRKT